MSKGSGFTCMGHKYGHKYFLNSPLQCSLFAFWAVFCFHLGIESIEVTKIKMELEKIQVFST